MSGQKKPRKYAALGKPRKAKKPGKSRAIPAALHPTLILLNANIVTMDEKRPAAQAVAVANERIIAVGSNEEIRGLIGPTSKVHDVNGATILPGFTDCHIHLIEYGLSLRGIDLRGVSSISEVKKRVAERARGSTPWIFGRGWDQEKFVEKRYPTRQDLDEVSPDKPVILWRVCGHICATNSAALALAGITAETSDLAGGIIDRNSAGEPTGILRETAVAILERAIPPLTIDDYEEATVAACHRALEAGLTTVHCILGSELELRALLRLRAEGRLPLRFYVYLPTQLLKATVSLGLRSGLGDSWVRIGGIKVFTDGSLGARTAALEEPYSDDPENRGVAIYTQQQLDEIISEAHRSELQIACHVIGDRAMSMALEAYSKAFEAMPANKNMRHRIEHLSVTNANLLERMRKLNLIASVQPHFTVSDFWIPERLGPERATQTNAYQSILKAGMTVVGGSDCPVEPLAPLTGIEAAVNRQGPEAVSVYSAISFYTRNAAYASFDEAEKGTITAGKLADLVILQLDPREIPAGEISKIPILTTIVGGRIRHPRPARS